MEVTQIEPPPKPNVKVELTQAEATELRLKLGSMSYPGDVILKLWGELMSLGY